MRLPCEYGRTRRFGVPKVSLSETTQRAGDTGSGDDFEAWIPAIEWDATGFGSVSSELHPRSCTTLTLNNREPAAKILTYKETAPPKTGRTHPSA